MTATIDYFPKWKNNATPVERLDELASVARNKPHEFKKIAVAYEETLPDGCTVLRTISAGCNTTELVGLFMTAAHDTMHENTKPRD